MAIIFLVSGLGQFNIYQFVSMIVLTFFRWDPSDRTG